MSFKITGITPTGSKFDVPMTINQSKSFNALKLAKQYQDMYGPGYTFVLVPLYQGFNKKDK